MTSNRSRAKPQANLPPPSIPAALDGGLGYGDIEADPGGYLAVLVGPWADFQDGDTLQILWGDAQTIVATYAASAQNASQVFPVDVPVSSVKREGEGTRAVCCRVTPRVGDTIESTAFSVEVKFTVPGGTDPFPDTPYRNENLASPTVDPSPVREEAAGVVVTVAPYTHMAVDDVVTVSWAGFFVSAPPLTGIGLPVEIVIDRATLERAGGGDLPVTYQVYDRVNNWSRWAPEAITEVRIEDPAAILPPWVEGTENDDGKVLDLDALGTGDVEVTVDPYVDSATGDLVAVHWEGTTASGQTIVHDPESKVQSRAHKSLSFAIPNAYAAPLAQGNARVSYTLTPPGGKPLVSRRHYLSLTGTVRTLPAPAVREAKGDLLDPADTPLGATVSVDAWPGMTAGDRVFLTWQGRRANGQATYYAAERAISGSAVGNPVVFTVPPAEVTVLDNGSVELYYTLDTYGTSNTLGIQTMRLLSRLESPHLSLSVRDATSEPVLPAPEVADLIDGVLDPDLSSTELVVLPYPGMAVKDRVDIYWNGAVGFTDFLPVRDVGQPLSFYIDASYIAGNRDQNVIAGYSVTRVDGGTAASASLGFLVSKTAGPPLYIETSPVTLHVGATYRREASGGRRPYIYTSTDASIVRVTDSTNGSIEALAHGTASIVAQDASLETVSYSVDVAANDFEDFESHGHVIFGAYEERFIRVGTVFASSHVEGAVSIVRREHTGPVQGFRLQLLGSLADTQLAIISIRPGAKRLRFDYAAKGPWLANVTGTVNGIENHELSSESDSLDIRLNGLYTTYVYLSQRFWGESLMIDNIRID